MQTNKTFEFSEQALAAMIQPAMAALDALEKFGLADRQVNDFCFAVDTADRIGRAFYQLRDRLDAMALAQIKRSNPNSGAVSSYRQPAHRVEAAAKPGRPAVNAGPTTPRSSKEIVADIAKFTGKKTAHATVAPGKAKTISRAQLAAMSPSERMNHFKNGGRLAD